ncbi:MAG: VOC family protein [Christensenellales bacterium]
MSLYKGLDHIGVYTTDLQGSEDFYVKTLGFELLSRQRATRADGSEFGMCFVAAGSCEIELVEVAELPASGVIAHIALEVEDIELAMATLKDKGVDFPTPYGEMSILGGIKNVFFSGPSGERLELVQRLG